MYGSLKLRTDDEGSRLIKYDVVSIDLPYYREETFMRKTMVHVIFNKGMFFFRPPHFVEE